MITPQELVEEMLRLSRNLDEVQSELVRTATEWAARENVYRSAKANSFLSTTGTVQARQAQTDKVCATERYEAHLAEALKTAALESVRNVRAQLSALQSIANAVRSELEMSGRYEESNR